MKTIIWLLPFTMVVVGCASQDIPQAYRGQMFDRTGPLAFYAGGKGFKGPILDPGTYYTGTYDDVRLVQCTVVTQREPLTALTQDGVQFKLDVYIRYAANCSDPSVARILKSIAPDATNTVTADELYHVYVRPTLLEVVREVVSPYKANDINDKRETVLQSVRTRFMARMREVGQDMVAVHDISLTNLDFPEEMDRANVQRAVQGVLKDKAIAERERVEAEIETAKVRIQLSEQEAQASAVRILRVGDMLRKYPEYLQFDLQSRMPDIYREAGISGNLIIAAPNPVIPAFRTSQAPARVQAGVVPPATPNAVPQSRTQPKPTARDADESTGSTASAGQ